MKNRDKKNVIIIILIVIIICLLGYFIYDRLGMSTSSNIVKDKSSENNLNDLENDEKEDNDQKITYTISYKEDEYITKNTAGYTISVSKRNLPVITNKNNQAAADKIVSSLTDISNEDWNGSIKEMADQVAEMESDKDLGLGVTYLFSTGVLTENRLTFRLEMDGSFGGVTWAGDTGYNYDAKTGELLTLESIAVDYNNLQNIMIEKIEEYIENYPYEINLNDYDGIEEAKNDPNWRKLLIELINQSGNWYFTETGIKICLPKYSVAVGASGIIKVDIEKNIFIHYVKEEYQVD